MTIAALILIALAGALHVYIFAIESVVWRSKRTWRIFGIKDETTAEIARPWAFNQGFYNLFLAIGATGGAIAAVIGSTGPVCMAMSEECLRAAVQVEWVGIAGTAIAAFSAACMVGAALVLAISGGRASLRSAAMQGTLPALGLILLAIGAAVGA